MQGVFWASLITLFVGIGMTLLVPGVKLRGRGPQPVEEAVVEALATSDPAETAPPAKA
jgi:hypothetical protein